MRKKNQRLTPKMSVSVNGVTFEEKGASEKGTLEQRGARSKGGTNSLVFRCAESELPISGRVSARDLNTDRSSKIRLEIRVLVP